MSVSPISCTVIVPIKPWALAKSRLHVPAPVREQLSRGFALDVLDVIADTPHVGHLIVVTTEIEIRSLGRRRGATVLSDRSMMSANSLNDAVLHARSWSMARRPSSPAVVVPSDLPALTVAALSGALEMMFAYARSFVPDSAGTGTTMLSARRPADLSPVYGPQSARSHTLAGHRAVPEVDVRARHDVDTAQDLTKAGLLGLRPHTSDVVASEWRGNHRYLQAGDHASVG